MTMRYLTYFEAVGEHFALMRERKEVRYGIFDQSLIESALARPQQAAAYNNADLYEQAATLCFGLIKNHPWIGGNKRTATYLTDLFLQHNGFEISCTQAEVLELVYAVEADQWDVTRIAEWMRQHVHPLR
jgi:death on curing protein